MIVHIVEKDINRACIRALIDNGKPMRSIDFHKKVGKKLQISIPANHKALSRLVKWNVLVREGMLYYISMKFYLEVDSIQKELVGKKKALVR